MDESLPILRKTFAPSGETRDIHRAGGRTRVDCVRRPILRQMEQGIAADQGHVTTGGSSS
jgi:hypothetical protein